MQRFAQSYGVLELCEHGLPATHNPRLLSIPLIGLINSPSLWKPIETGTERARGFVIEDSGERTWCEPTGSESIESWLFWSRIAASLLNVASGGVNVTSFATEAAVIAAFQAAFDSGDYEAAKNIFEELNEEGCPLN